MKKFSFILVLIFSYQIHAQQTIFDTAIVYHNNYILDSINLKVRTKVAALDTIAFSNVANDACATTPFGIIFKGCTTNTYRIVDTTYIFTPNTVWTKKIHFQTGWDTSMNCSYPSSLNYVTHYIWEPCTSTSLDEINKESAFKIYPNPASNFVQVNSEMAIDKFTFYSNSGKPTKQIVGNEKLLDISDLPKGLYIIQIQFENGNRINKKLVVEH